MFCVYLLEEKCNFIRYYSFINLWYPNLSQSPFLSVGTERTGEFSCIPSWYPFPLKTTDRKGHKFSFGKP